MKRIAHLNHWMSQNQRVKDVCVCVWTGGVWSPMGTAVFTRTTILYHNNWHHHRIAYQMSESQVLTFKASDCGVPTITLTLNKVKVQAGRKCMGIITELSLHWVVFFPTFTYFLEHMICNIFMYLTYKRICRIIAHVNSLMLKSTCH